MIKVQRIKINGQWMYGITDGTKWFFYGYRTRLAAGAVVRACGGFQEDIVRRVNISYSNPQHLSEFTG